MALAGDIAHIMSVDGPADAGARAVATVRITLPDDLARDLTEAGLLEPQVIESILRDRLRATRIADLRKIRATLRAAPLEPMTGDEINAEIEAYRAEQRCAAGACDQSTSFAGAKTFQKVMDWMDRPATSAEAAGMARLRDAQAPWRRG
jgi:hypothetical protein